MVKMVECLLESTEDEELIFICGSNKKGEKHLKKTFGSEKRLTILGYTHQMSLYMKACDILFTKPGGLTSTEAAVSGIPIIHTEPIPGCETANCKFFGKYGMSVSGTTVKGQVQAGLRILYDEKEASKMKENQQKNINKMAADDICYFIREHLNDK